jgi:hypothetical protein
MSGLKTSLEAEASWGLFELLVSFDSGIRLEAMSRSRELRNRDARPVLRCDVAFRQKSSWKVISCAAAALGDRIPEGGGQGLRSESEYWSWLD